MNGFIWKLYEGKKICFDSYKSLRCSDSVSPCRYGLPKIYKPNVPLRTIVSFVGSATNTLSKFLKNVLSPLVSTTKYSVKNSKEFVDLLSPIKIRDFELQVSSEVCYKTNITSVFPISHAELGAFTLLVSQLLLN